MRGYRGIITGILVLLLVVGLVITPIEQLIIIKAESYSSPIVIIDNNYNIPYIKGGNGTKESPYIIENVTISVSGEPALMIENSNKHILIRNVTLISRNYKAVVQFYNTSNVILRNVRICGEMSDYGILLNNVSQASFLNLTINGTLAPLLFTSPNDLKNAFKNVLFYGKKVLIITDRSNIILSGTYAQIFLYNVENATLDGVSIAAGGIEFINFGLWVSKAIGLVIENSAIKAARAVTIESSRNVTIKNSTLVFTNYGISIENSSYVIISNVAHVANMKNVALRIRGSSKVFIEKLQLNSIGLSVVNSKDVIISEVKISENILNIEGSKDIRLTNVEITNNKVTSLEISSSESIYIKGLVMKNIRFVYGVDVEKEERVNAFVMKFVKDITVESSIIQNVYAGIVIISGNGITLRNTTIYDAIIGLEGYYMNNLTVLDSYVAKIVSVGLRIMHSNNVVISASKFSKISVTGIEFFSVKNAKVEHNVFENIKNYVVEDSQHYYLHNYWDKYTGEDKNGDGYGDEKFQVTSFSWDPAPSIEKTTNPPAPTPEIPRSWLSGESIILIGIIVIFVVVIIFNVIYYIKTRRERL